jgi:hypothetical protein
MRKALQSQCWHPCLRVKTANRRSSGAPNGSAVGYPPRIERPAPAQLCPLGVTNERATRCECSEQIREASNDDTKIFSPYPRMNAAFTPFCPAPFEGS